MALFRFGAFALAALVCSAPAAAQSEPAPILEEALATTRAMAFRSNQLDWPALEARVRDAAEDARDIVDLLGAFEVLVEGLGDGHSFVNATAADRAEFRARYGREFDALRFQKPVTSSFRSRREPEARAIALRGNTKVQLVTVPMKQGGGAAATQYANALFAQVAAGADKSCGDIVDLRGNQGGNIWPMVAGLMALLGEGWKS